MKNVRWTDNICTVSHTCIHGWFTADDLEKLFALCPSGSFTHTFHQEGLPVGGYNRDGVARIRALGIGDKERGYYFTFRESDGEELIRHLSTMFPMVRGEGAR